MKKLFLTFLILATGLTLGLPLQAATLKVATITPEGSKWMTDMRAGAKEIKERTEGRVQIKFYGGGVMGNDQKVLSRIRIGSLQGGAFTPTALVNQYPDLNLYGLPMVFDTTEEASYVRTRLDSRLTAGLEEAGYVSFGFAGGGFALLMSNTRIEKFEDLKGKKVWIPEGDVISRQAMEALSLSPVTLPLTDVLTGLQTGLIDIVGMSPIGALVLQWHTKLKYDLRYVRRIILVDRLRTAGQDHAGRCKIPNSVFLDIPGVNLRINTTLADTAGDELCVLAAKIENHHPVGMNIGLRGA